MDISIQGASEHNLIIDLGPDAGDDGGKVLLSGPHDKLFEVAGSKTGQALKNEPSIVPTRSTEPHILLYLETKQVRYYVVILLVLFAYKN